MLSDTSFTTHTSSLFSGLTDTGSIPTGISAISTGLPGFDTSKTDKRESGVLTAKRRVPSGERRIGLVCLPSKLTKFVIWPKALWLNKIRAGKQIQANERRGF